MYLLDSVSSGFFFEPAGYFYTFNDFFNFFVFNEYKFIIFYNHLFLNFLFSSNLFVILFIFFFIAFYLVLLFIILFIFFFNFIIKFSVVANFLMVFYFIVFSSISFLLNIFPISRLYLSHKNFDYKFRLNLFESLSVSLSTSYSNKAIWLLWNFFLNVVHLQSFLLYVNFIFVYCLRFIFIWFCCYFFYFFWRLKRVFILNFSNYAYFSFYLFQLLFIYCFNLLVIFDVGRWWKRIYVNYYDLIYINILLHIFYKISIFFYNKFNLITDVKKSVFFANTSLFSFFVNFMFFNIIFYSYNLLKLILINQRVSKFFLYVFKVIIYSFFLLLSFFIQINLRNIWWYFIYFWIFYFNTISLIFYKFLLNIIFYLNKFFYFFYFVLNYLILPFFIYIFRLIFIIFVYLYRIIIKSRVLYFFCCILFLVLINFINVFYVYNILAFLFDFFLYIYSFFALLLKPFVGVFIWFFSLDLFIYKPFFKLTFFHNFLIDGVTYTFLADIYYYIKLQFILYFPYKVFLIIHCLFYIKNIIFYFFYLQQFFLFSWYFYFFILLEHFNFIAIIFTWLYLFFFFFTHIISFLLYLFISNVDIFFYWLLDISIKNFSMFFLLDFFELFEDFLLKLFVLDLFTNFLSVVDFYNLVFLHVNKINTFDFFFFNIIASWFFILYDYFFYFSYQYPFDAYTDAPNNLVDNKFYFKQKLRSRMYRYYYYYYYYYYKAKYGNNFFFNNDDVINFSSPLVKYKHKLRKVPSLSHYQMFNFKIFLPTLYKKWEFLLLTKLKYKLIWGNRLKRFQLKSSWLNDLYRSKIFFINENLSPLALTVGTSFTIYDENITFGFYEVDSLFNLNLLIILLFLFIFFFIFSKSFRSLYFPELWFINNSEYLWNIFRLDFSKHNLWMYLDRSSMLPLGITKQEIQEGTRFTYKDLAERAGLDKTNFMSFVYSKDFLSYYKNRYPGDFDKLVVFDYFCISSLEHNSCFSPMYLRESYHHLTDLGSEVVEYLSVPIKFDFQKRLELLNQLNKFFFNIDSYFHFKLPDWTFHKELANHAYYQFPDGTYFIPYDKSNLFENFNIWLIIFPLSVYHFGSFEFIYSMDSLVLLDIFHKLCAFLSLNYFFDTFFYFFYFDLVVMESNSVNSQWTYVPGIYDDRLFYSKFPLFEGYYDIMYRKKFIILDYILNFFKTFSVIDVSFKFLLIHFLLYLIYFFMLIFFGFSFISKMKIFIYKNKNLFFVDKLKFYFYKKQSLVKFFLWS